MSIAYRRLTLVAFPGEPPASVRLRRALKDLLRSYRLRCRSVEVYLPRNGGPHDGSWRARGIGLLGSVSPHVEEWRRFRRGPRFVKIPGGECRGHGNAGRVLYRESDLLAYLEALAVPTEEPPMLATVFRSA